MPRAKFNPWELDQNVQLEDGVRDTLREHPIACVSVSVMNTCYEIRDAEENTLDSTVPEKCAALACEVGAEYEIRGEEVWFRRMP